MNYHKEKLKTVMLLALLEECFEELGMSADAIAILEEYLDRFDEYQFLPALTEIKVRTGK